MNKRVKITALVLSCFTMFLVGFSIYNSANVINANAQESVMIVNAIYKQGSRGSTVKTIQQKLKRWGYYKGAVDGIFGSQTKKAVRYFQQKNGLKVDGIVGPQTLKALGISASGSSGSSSSSGTSFTNAEVTLLARLIYGEARGESYTGQIAVGAVVMNRLRSSSFPNTISGVIYQPYAFTAVDDGQINAAVESSCYKAARDALNGWDPTGGAIYYYNPVTATNQWIRTRPVIKTIGKHVFCK